MAGRWFTEERSELIKALRDPFKISKLSKRAQSSIIREGDLSIFMERIKQQILEYNELGLPWKTPEDWDSSFDFIGGGQSRRKASSILKRMSWETFLLKCENIFSGFN